MNILLIILSTGLLAVFMWAGLNPRHLYRFSVLWSASFAGFALPQLIGIGNETSQLTVGVLPEGAHDLVTLVSILSLAGIVIGDSRGVNHPGHRPIIGWDRYNSERITIVAVSLALTGWLIFQIGYSMLDKRYLETLGTQASGPITILYFFLAMQRYGFALCLLCYFRYRSVIALLTSIFIIGSQFVTFLLYARRGTTADILFILLLGLYFGRRIVLPSWLLASVFLAGTLFSNSIGAFRNQEDVPFLERLEKADLFGQFAWTLNNGGLELTNAAVIIWAVDHEGDFDYGTAIWNQLVHAYFPGQIFGFELKRALMFTERNHAFEVCNYTAVSGSTATGMCDSFRSFWYFGCISFFIIGYVMGRWYVRANQGDVWSQLAYMALMVSALHTITHGTPWLLNGYIHMFVFAYFPLYWARHTHHEISDSEGNKIMVRG